MNSCCLINLRNYNAPLTPVNEVYTGALQRLARDAQDRTWWNREFTGEQAVSYLESAAYNPLEDYIIKHPEFLLGPANLALNAAKTAGALALQKVAPKLLATAAVSNTWDNFLSYMKGGKQEVTRKNAEKRVDIKYGEGKFWDSLITKSKDPKLIGLSRKAKADIRMDTNGFYYKFDPFHKTAKIHLHKYRHVNGNKYQLVEEVHPITGESKIVPNGGIETW